MEHLLLNNAFSYKRRNAIESPQGFMYDKKLGAWIEEKTGNPLVLHQDYPRIGTKKQDVETGEDQKSQ